MRLNWDHLLINVAPSIPMSNYDLVGGPIFKALNLHLLFDILNLNLIEDHGYGAIKLRVGIMLWG